jgi:hypothetical protein
MPCSAPPPPLHAGLEESRAWLAPHVRTPAAAAAPGGRTRLRPLIYVYELPAFYNQVMLQVRQGGSGVGCSLEAGGIPWPNPCLSISDFSGSNPWIDAPFKNPSISCGWVLIKAPLDPLRLEP